MGFTRVQLQYQRVSLAVAFHLSQSMHIVDQLHIAASLLDVSACKHALLSTDHNLGWKARQLSEQSSVVHEARHITGYKPVHHAADTNNFSREDSSVDRGF